MVAILLGIVILAAVVIWMNRTGQGPAGAAAPARKRVVCDFQRVNLDETRALKEFRCAACGEVAYAKGDARPAARTCSSATHPPQMQRICQTAHGRHSPNQ